MNVYVVMAQGYTNTSRTTPKELPTPSAVFQDEALADAYCEQWNNRNQYATYWVTVTRQIDDARWLTKD